MRMQVLIVLAFSGVPASGMDVVGIADGDTLTILQDGRPARIRLANVDAPEKRQGFGQRSKQSLSDLCYGKDAVIRVISPDRYGRSVALVGCNGIDASRAQVERGLAWVYPRYNQDPSLPALQTAAAAERRGLWAEPNRYRLGSSGAPAADVVVCCQYRRKKLSCPDSATMSPVEIVLTCASARSVLGSTRIVSPCVDA